MGNELTKQDSLNFRFYKGDTLVLVEPGMFVIQNPNEVKVPYEPKDEDFLNIYKQIVFGPPEETEKNETIKIWKNGVRLFFDPSVPKQHRLELLKFAYKVSAGIDSLKIEEVQERAQSNFLIFYRNSEDDFDQEPRISNKSKGSYYLDWNGKQQFTRGVIKINAYAIPRPKDELDLLKFYFFRSLGHFSNSPELSCESYLSACRTKRKITKKDLEILAYHYSYGICKGIDRENFEKIHRDYKKIMAEHPGSEFYMVHKN